MANQFFPLTPEDSGSSLFVATQSGPIQRTDCGVPIKRGLVLLNSTTALAMTLAAPVAGPQIAGGDDGKELRIIVVSTAPLTAGVSHTVTCPSNSIKALFSTMTFQASQGEAVSMVAYNGSWWPYIGDAALS